MPALSEMDRVGLEEIEREEQNPGEGLISQAHSDQLVTLGLAKGSWQAGYRLTEDGRRALDAARSVSGA